MKKLALAVLTLAVAASPASAQVWNTFTPSNSGPGFWNNSSHDNVTTNDICNVGNVLTNASLTSTNCLNNTPGNLLPAKRFDSGVGGGAFLNGAAGFAFGAGTWTIDLIGQMAGAVPTVWGIVTSTGEYIAYAGSPMTVTTTSGFALWIDTFDPASNPNRFNSLGMQCQNDVIFPIGCAASTQQHAVFNPNAGLNGTTNGFVVESGFALLGSGQYYVGMEDNATNASDFDYNDVILSVSSVPEPSTYALMATGLVALFGIARRRRAQ